MEQTLACPDWGPADTIAFRIGGSLTALGAVFSPAATTVGLGLGGCELYQLGEGIYDITKNWNHMDGPDRFQDPLPVP